jgi:PPM family protein phosphatase
MANAGPGAPRERFHRRFTVCGGTNIGARRSENQDTFVIADLESGRVSRPCIRTDVWVSRPGVLMLVCDGGPPAGEVAAQLTASSIKHGLEAEGENVGLAPVHSLRRALQGANRALLEEADSHPDERGMTTTCTAAIVSPDRLAVVQVGDSRAYLLRDGSLRTLTDEETPVGLRGGQGKGDDRTAGAASGSQLEASSQTLGARADVQPATADVDVRAGDRVLLCSNGLHGLVSDDAIAAILMRTPEVAAASEALIAAALAAGGGDSVTVVLADCGPLEHAAPRGSPTPRLVEGGGP